MTSITALVHVHNDTILTFSRQKWDFNVPLLIQSNTPGKIFAACVSNVYYMYILSEDLIPSCDSAMSPKCPRL